MDHITLKDALVGTLFLGEQCKVYRVVGQQPETQTTVTEVVLVRYYDHTFHVWGPWEFADGTFTDNGRQVVNCCDYSTVKPVSLAVLHDGCFM